MPARPQPVRPPPALQPPLTCLSSWVRSRMAARAPSSRRRSPEGLETKFGTPVPHSHSDTDTSLRPHPADPPGPPTSHQRLRPGHHPQSVGSSRPRGPPKIPQVGIPFSSPPPVPVASAPPLWDDRGMRTGSRLFLAGGSLRSEAAAPRTEAKLPGRENPPPSPELSHLPTEI